MAQIRQEALDYELRRWMPPDWRRFWKRGHENDPLYREMERVERKFSPDQPRVPAGAREGGQWASGNGQGRSSDPSQAGSGAQVLDRGRGASSSADAVVQSFIEKAKRLAAGGKSAYERCSDLCYPILERFQPVGSDRNTFDFFKCLNACLGKNQ